MKFNLIASSILRPWLWFTKPLTLDQLHPNPFVQFARCYRLAQRCIWLEFPDAVCLSTVTTEGTPDSRMVLLRDFDSRGFTIFTNYNSTKGQQLSCKGEASLTFFWDALQRQVRVHGRVERTTKAESDAYFKTRSRGSQISAWASAQSMPLQSSNQLDQLVLEFSNKFKDIDIPRPEHWGGFRIVPQKMEFWKARPERLHDRFLYSLDAKGDWKVSQLFP